MKTTGWVRSVSNLSSKAVLFLAGAYIVSMSAVVWWAFTPSSVFELGFGFGSVARQIAEGDLAPSATRSPAIPYFLAAIAFLRAGSLTAILVKNLLLQPLMLWSLYRCVTGTRLRIVAMGSALFILTYPPLVVHGFSIIPEQGWIIAMLAFLFYELLYSEPAFRTGAYSFVGLLLALTLLVDGKMRLLSPVLVLLFFLRGRNWRIVAVLGGFCAAGFLAWGAYNYAATGEMRFGTSLDGYNFYKGNNPRSLEFYPDRTLDHLSGELANMAGVGQASSEWVAHETYVREALAFWRESPGAAYRLFLLRTYKMFLAITPVELGDKGPALLTVRIVSILYSLVFRVVLVLSLIYALWQVARWGRRSIWQRERGRADGPAPTIEAFCFLAFTLAYSAPFLIGFAYERHVLPLVMPTFLFGIWVLEKEGDRLRRILLVLLSGKAQSRT